LLQQEMMDVAVMTTGTLGGHAKRQAKSNHHHHHCSTQIL